MIVAAFELPTDAGTHFAVEFTKILGQHRDTPMTIFEAFTKASERTATNLEEFYNDDKALGRSLELVLVGNPNLRICATTPLPNQ
jgi:hypothetical protein